MGGGLDDGGDSEALANGPTELFDAMGEPAAGGLKSFGAFRIGGALGDGGSGEVYAAERDGVPLALKVLRADVALTDSERARFFEEAKTLADIEHPNVVSLRGHGCLPDGRPYVAMERLRGETLAVRLKRGALPKAQALLVFQQLAGALTAIHEQSLVHRDVKPENVMIVDGGSRAVLLDLGIAKRVDAGPSTTTRDGRVRGTPAYMAPERFYGTSATVRSDVYELALLLYVMLAGRHPWRDRTDPAARHHPLPLDGEDVRGLTPVLLQALNVDRQLRPATPALLYDEVVLSATGVGGDATATATADVAIAPPPYDAAELNGEVVVADSTAARALSEVPPTIEPVSLKRLENSPAGGAELRSGDFDDTQRTPGPAVREQRPAEASARRRWVLPLVAGLAGLTPWLAMRSSEPGEASVMGRGLASAARSLPSAVAVAEPSDSPNEMAAAEPASSADGKAPSSPSAVALIGSRATAPAPLVSSRPHSHAPPAAGPAAASALPSANSYVGAVLPGGARIQAAKTTPDNHSVWCDRLIASHCTPESFAMDHGDSCNLMKDIVRKMTEVYDLTPDPNDLGAGCKRQYGPQKASHEGRIQRWREAEAHRRKADAERLRREQRQREQKLRRDKETREREARKRAREARNKERRRKRLERERRHNK